MRTPTILCRIIVRYGWRVGVITFIYYGFSRCASSRADSREAASSDDEILDRRRKPVLHISQAHQFFDIATYTTVVTIFSTAPRMIICCKVLVCAKLKKT
jgi:hypothetical protein